MKFWLALAVVASVVCIYDARRPLPSQFVQTFQLGQNLGHPVVFKKAGYIECNTLSTNIQIPHGVLYKHAVVKLSLSCRDNIPKVKLHRNHISIVFKYRPAERIFYSVVLRGCRTHPHPLDALSKSAGNTEDESGEPAPPAPLADDE